MKEEAGFEEGVDNSNVRYVQNVSLDRGPVGIEDFENELGEMFEIPFSCKADLEVDEFNRHGEGFDISGEIKSFRPSSYEIRALDLLDESGLLSSRSEARRIIKQGGFYISRFDGEYERVSDFNEILKLDGRELLKVGNRKFARVGIKIREAIDNSEGLANLIELGHLVVITKEQYEDSDWNSDLLPPVPPWEEEVGVERNILYDVPPTEYDLKLLKSLKKEDGRRGIKIERVKGGKNNE